MNDSRVFRDTIPANLSTIPIRFYDSLYLKIGCVNYVCTFCKSGHTLWLVLVLLTT